MTTWRVRAAVALGVCATLFLPITMDGAFHHGWPLWLVFVSLVISLTGTVGIVAYLGRTQDD